MKVNDMKARLLNLEETFKKHESELTELDRAIGDGDHGVNMVRGFSSLKDKLDDSSMQSLFKSTGMALMSNVGGASGPLYGFSFVKMSAVTKDDMDNQDFITLIQAFAEAVESRGKVTLNEKTMYDVVARAAGGLPDGSIGTSFDIIQEVLTKLEDDALCFYDIGSSEMNVDMAIEMYEGNHRVLKVDAPIVEGSFIAAVKLSIGGSIDDALAEIKQSF